MEFKLWLETTYKELYKSTVEAFPKTTKRQHVTDPIVISDIIQIPYLGLNTLFVKAVAENNLHQYKPIILFKQINYTDQEKPINLNSESNMLVRCNCNDFYYRFNYFDHKDKILYGKVRKKYEAKFNPGSANPLKMPGMCKHILKLYEELVNKKLIKDA